MNNPRSDPSEHRRLEQQMIQHVERLLSDDRLRLDTTRGARSIGLLQRDVTRADRAVDLHRLMSEMNIPDRELEARMPIGQALEVALTQTRWLVFKQIVGRLRVVSAPPWRALLKGETPKPMATAELQKVLSSLPPSLNGEPATVVVVSTAGFTIEARELADRRAERSVVLAEPNDAGGWRVVGPPETRALVELFDPEAEADKRKRVRGQIELLKSDFLAGGVSADKVAAKSQVSQGLVESELKAYAAEHAGLVAKRLDGRLVLFREGSSAPPSAAAAHAPGGSDMPLFDRVKALFSRKGDDEKKISFLSERRTALSQQRDIAYEDMGTLETQETDLRKQFKEAAGTITKRRITSQLVQLRKDVERRQQLVAVLNQQINVVSTHLHNLELSQQGRVAQLPSPEEMTEDAVKAEEMLAELEATSELSVGSSMLGVGGMTEEEQALYDELEGEGTVRDERPSEAADAEVPPPIKRPGETDRTAERPSPPERVSRRSEPEAG